MKRRSSHRNVLKRPAARKSATKAVPIVIKLDDEQLNNLIVGSFRCPLSFSGSMPLIIGTDCAGLMSTELALEQTGLKNKMTCAFASEIDDKTRMVLVRNHKVALLFGDITHRDVRQAPRVHLYTAGPPCQPFSSEGLGGGVTDVRGQVLFSVLSYIETQKPVTFMIENVAGLARRHGGLLAAIIKFLGDLQDASGKSSLYEVNHALLNTRIHGGLPQNRPRLYITGIMKSMKQRAFTWPGAIPMVSVNDLLLPATGPPDNMPSGLSGLRNYANMLEYIAKKGSTPSEPWIGDVASGRGDAVPQQGVVPCLTRSRSGTSGHWLFHKRRKMLLREIEACQGIPNDRIHWEGLCSESRYKQMIGNAFTVPVAGRVALALLRTIVAASVLPDLQDPWGL